MIHFVNEGECTQYMSTELYHLNHCKCTLHNQTLRSNRVNVKKGISSNTVSSVRTLTVTIVHHSFYMHSQSGCLMRLESFHQWLSCDKTVPITLLIQDLIQSFFDIAAPIEIEPVFTIPIFVNFSHYIVIAVLLSHKLPSIQRTCLSHFLPSASVLLLLQAPICGAHYIRCLFLVMKYFMLKLSAPCQ